MIKQPTPKKVVSNHIWVIILACIITISTPCLTRAIELKNVDAFTTSATDKLDTEYWVASRSADVAGSITDDLFLLNMTTGVLSGTFESEVWCLSAMLLNLSGTVQDDARVMSKTIQVSGQIGSSLLTLGNTILVTDKAVIAKDVVLIGEEVIFQGTTTDGRLLMIGNKVTLSGKIARSVRLIANDIVVMPHTEIAGDLVYTAEKELVLNDKVILKGELKKKEMSETLPKSFTGFSWKRSAMFQFYFFAAAALVGMVWLALFPGFSNSAVNSIRKSTMRCILFGPVALFGIPFLCSFIAVTVIGLPLAMVLLTLYILMIYIGKIMVAFAIGTIVTRLTNATRVSQSFSALFIGLIIIYGLEWVPLAGPYISMATTVIGFGTIINVIFSNRMPPPPPKENNNAVSQS